MSWKYFQRYFSSKWNTNASKNNDANKTENIDLETFPTNTNFFVALQGI